MTEVEEGCVERTAPYLRPQQVRNYIEEADGIEHMLQAPPHIANQIQDRAAMMRHLRHIRHELEVNSPTPYREAERDVAARRERELREKITEAMPTQAEMRRNPHGAVDKHRKWERDHKKRLLEWKNIRLRMHTSGMLDEHPDAHDVANIEQYRPAYAGHELGMHDVQIEGKQFFMPRGAIPAQNVMDAEEAAAGRESMEALMALMAEYPDTTIAEFHKIAAERGLMKPAADAKPAEEEAGTGKGKGASARRSN